MRRKEEAFSVWLLRQDAPTEGNWRAEFSLTHKQFQSPVCLGRDWWQKPEALAASAVRNERDERVCSVYFLFLDPRPWNGAASIQEGLPSQLTKYACPSHVYPDTNHRQSLTGMPVYVWWEYVWSNCQSMLNHHRRKQPNVMLLRHLYFPRVSRAAPLWRAFIWHEVERWKGLPSMSLAV